ncbi:MAG TPA: hypothetical protein ENN03_00180 [bacterium]|nr:hypothetical protein [bacterium]
MHSVLYFVYNCFIIGPLFLIFHLTALINPKIRSGIRGRKHLFRDLERKCARLESKGPRIWIHSCSMGEYEQARPLIRVLKEQIPDSVVIVSFFSPSVFNHVSDDGFADLYCYIPFDSRRNAARFLSIIKPRVAVMVRHDLWPNHLAECRSRSIPLILVNCSIRPHHLITRFCACLVHRFLYGYFNRILTVSRESEQYCRKLFPSVPIQMVGDTRYDQVVWRALRAEDEVAPLRTMKGDRVGFVAGSTWPSDEEVLLPAIHKIFSKGLPVWFILVPHEPTSEHLRAIEKQLNGMNLTHLRFSQAIGSQNGFCNVLLVDRVGILSSLYALGELTFVGGGFGPGIHNVLEPAALGKVVVFGPRHKNSHEAGRLKERGVGFVVDDKKGTFLLLDKLFQEEGRLRELGERAESLIQDNIGASRRIVDRIQSLLTQTT